MCFPRHFRFLFPNSMNTGSFSCFVFPSRLLLCFLFLPLFVFVCVFFVFCFFTACSLFFLKLSFLSQKVLIFISKLHEHRFIFLIFLSKVKYFCVPEPSPTLLSLDFLAFWVQICSIEYLCDQQQQRRQQIVSGIWRTGL